MGGTITSETGEELSGSFLTLSKSNVLAQGGFYKQQQSKDVAQTSYD